MRSDREGPKLFTGNANLALAQEIAAHLNTRLGAIEVTRFSNGEIQVIIEESVRGTDAFVIQPTGAPANDSLMELLIIIDALRRASARRITAVVPYFGYARQDRKTRGREPITAKLVANLIVTARAGRVLTMDLHAGQIQGFFDIPVDHLSAIPILACHLRERDLGEVVVVSPDVGGVPRARDMAARLGAASLAFLDKRRPRPGDAEIYHVVGDVSGKRAILVDDMIDTAGSITRSASALIEKGGAAGVYAACTHAVLSGTALERLETSVISEVVVTNTLPLAPGLPRLTVLSVAPLLAEAIFRIHNDLSVSELFL